MADRGAGSLWACWGALCKSPNSPKVEPEKTFNFDDDVGNLVLDHTRMDGDGGAVRGRCQTLLCPRWVLLLFVTEFQGRAGPGVTEEVLTTVVGVAAKVEVNIVWEVTGSWRWRSPWCVENSDRVH